MLWPIPPFNDFGTYFSQMKWLHRPEFWTQPGASWDYPAPSIFVYQFFYLFNQPTNGHGHEVYFGFLAYLIFAAVTLLIAGFALARPLLRRYSWRAVLPFTAMSLLLCWPVYLGMQRGNIEVCLDSAICLGLVAFMRRRWMVGACLIGSFGAAKLYPLLLLSFLLPQRRWKEFASGLAVAAAVTLFATHWIGPVPVTARETHGIAYGIKNWVAVNSMTRVDVGFEFDHSIFGLIKRFIVHSPDRIAFWAIAYAGLFGGGLLCLFFAKTWRMPRPNQMLTVSLASVLLPPTSYDYTLALLLPVWAWFVLLAASPVRSIREQRILLAVIPMFAVIFAPEAFIILHGKLLQGQAKAIVLLGLLVISLLVPIFEYEAKKITPLPPPMQP